MAMHFATFSDIECSDGDLTLGKSLLGQDAFVKVRLSPAAIALC